MERVEIASLYKATPADGTKVTVCGWAKTVRDSKKIGFISLADGSCYKPVQIVFQADKLENYAEVAKSGLYTSFEVTGTLVLTPNAKQPFEINADTVTVLGTCGSDYPLQKNKMGMDYLRTLTHLRPRTNTFNAAFRVRGQAAYALHEFFHKNGFTYVHTPIFTGSDCEGAGEMFQVTTLDLNDVPKTEDGKVDYSKDFFKRPVNLTVSGQLEAEAMAMAFGKVYTFGPTFRAEKSFTTRHAAEFWMIEPEMAFCDLNGYMDTAEAMTKYVIRYVLDNCPDEMAFFNQFIDKGLIERLELVANSEFGRISYTDAIEILKKNNKKFQFPVEWGVDIQTEHERYLTEVVFKKPVFVTDYPKEIKSFYMKQNADGKTVAAADMLVPGIGELIGGGIPLVYFARKRSTHLYFVRPHLRWPVIGHACANGSSEMVTNIAMSLVGILYNWQLLRFIGEDGVAAYGVIMYTVMIFSAVFMGYSVGTSPLMSFQYGAQNHTEMRSLLWKSLGIIGVASIVMFLLGQWLAAPLSAIFVSYDAALLELTVSAYKLYALCFLFMGFAMYASAFFTALNNGLVSALISFLRTLVFQVAAVIVLPMLFGIDGIWLSVTVGDGLTCLVAATFMIALSGRYGYRKGGLSPKAKAKAENGD